jgi:hypothetical protein
MANRIILKKTSTPGKVPVTTIEDADAGLAYGELAINYADGKLFYRNASNVVGQIGGGSGGGGGTLRVFQRGDVVQEDAVVVSITSGVLGVVCRTVTNPSGTIGVSV